jgi:hypothetical protein
VNFATAPACRRCGSDLQAGRLADDAPAWEPAPERGLWRKALWIGSTTAAIVVVWYLSLVFSSDGLSPNERAMVRRATAIIADAGYAPEGLMLKHVATYRGTDNWWNVYAGHQEAYAATNFPFEVVTLYPEFFSVPVDDTERAVILFHEVQHLLGADEAEALTAVWQAKAQLGWTEDVYGRTQVWKNTRDWMKAVSSAN